MEQNENTLSVLKIAPGQYPQQVEINNDLKALQQAVGVQQSCHKEAEKSAGFKQHKSKDKSHHSTSDSSTPIYRFPSLS